MRTARALGGAAIAVQITYPLTTGSTRDVVSVVVVLLLAAASVVHAATVRGARWAAGLVVVTAGGGFAVELLGTATGFPFGAYTYAQGRLGPAVAGVPLLIAVAWTAGAYPAWCAAQRVTSSRVGRLVLAAVGLAAWDLYLDPQMVADGRWTWVRQDAGLPGVPAVPVGNYLGWLGVALVMAALLSLLPALPGSSRRDGLPLVLFGWTWLGSGLAQAVFLGLPASAAYGLVGMGVAGVPLLAVLWSGSARPWRVAVRAHRRWPGRLAR